MPVNKVYLRPNVSIILTVTSLIKWFNGLLGPLIFTIVNLKRRPAITSIVSYDMDSCPFTLVISLVRLDRSQDKNKIHISQLHSIAHILNSTATKASVKGSRAILCKMHLRL